MYCDTTSGEIERWAGSSFSPTTCLMKGVKILIFFKTSFLSTDLIVFVLLIFLLSCAYFINVSACCVQYIHAFLMSCWKMEQINSTSQNEKAPWDRKARQTVPFNQRISLLYGNLLTVWEFQGEGLGNICCCTLHYRVAVGTNLQLT